MCSSDLQLAAFLGAGSVADLGAAKDLARRVNNQVPCILTVDGALARERPEIVARYLAALQQAAQWSRTHREETYGIVADDVGATREWVEAAYGATLHEQLTLVLDPRGIEGLEAQKAFLLAQGVLQRDFPLKEWLDPRPLAMAQEIVLERAGG